MLDIKVKRWKANVSSYVILFLLAGVLLSLTYVMDDVVLDAVMLVSGAVLIFFGVARGYREYNRTKIIKKTVDRGKRLEGVIIGYRTKRNFDTDFSPFSLLDGSSGFQFPLLTVFEVKTAEGESYQSDLTNVPSKVAERYVSNGSIVYVYVYDSEFYVDIEGLPDYRLTQMI